MCADRAPRLGRSTLILITLAELQRLMPRPTNGPALTPTHHTHRSHGRRRHQAPSRTCRYQR